MFSKDITNSEEFLEMPDSTQKLYFHLNMNADDDGFVQPKGIMRMIRSGDDDLKLLAVKGFVIIFNGNVIVITQWKVNNDIRWDRYKPTIYQEHLKALSIDENKAYILDKNMVVPKVVPSGNQMATQVRLGKDRLGYSENKEKEETLTKLDDNGNPVVVKTRSTTKTAIATKNPALSVSLMWQKMACDHFSLSPDDIPPISVMKPVSACITKYNFTGDEFKDLFKHFLNDDIPEQKKVNIYLCLSDSYISQYKVYQKITPKTNASISGEMKL